MKKQLSRKAREALDLRISGVSINDIAAKFKVTGSRISQMTASPWREYLASKTNTSASPPLVKEKTIMGDRIFKHDKAFDSNTKGFVYGVSIRCASCGKTERLTGHSSHSNHSHIAQQFRNKGWAVGGSERADKCPSCLDALGLPVQKPEEKPNASFGEILSAALTAKPAPVNVVKPPIVMQNSPQPLTHQAVAMSKADKRIIFAKLNDVYADEKTGYSPGWDDASVAKDLGVDLEWVKQVRDADFGPVIDRFAEIKALLKALPNEGDLKSIIEDIDAIRKEVVQATISLAALNAALEKAGINKDKSYAKAS